MFQFFEITAARLPNNSESWFPGFTDGAQLPFDSHGDAEQYIKTLCERAGTINDPNYAVYGPVAVAV